MVFIGLSATYYGFYDSQFKKYAIFSWGCPLIVTLVTLVIQHLPSEWTKSIIRPDIGVTQCYFGSKKAELFYFHIINAPILLANLMFFLLFLWNMTCGTWANHDGEYAMSQQNKKKVRAVIKLFFVLGITWIAEIVSWGLEWAYGPEKVYKEVFVFQLINALQGLVMFCVIYLDGTRMQSLWNNFRRPSTSFATNVELTSM